MAKLRLQVLDLSLEISLVSKSLLSHLLRCLARRHDAHGFLFVGVVCLVERIVFRVGKLRPQEGSLSSDTT